MHRLSSLTKREPQAAADELVRLAWGGEFRPRRGSVVDVFLSYLHEDRAWVEQLDAALRAAGLTTWWDRRVLAGEDWDDEIRDHLEGAGCVVVLWSERSWASLWVQAEAHDAFNRDALVPARLDDVRLRVPFNKTQAEDLRPDGGLARLVVAVRAHLAGEGPKVAGRTPVPAPVRHQMAVIAAPEDRNRTRSPCPAARRRGRSAGRAAMGAGSRPRKSGRSRRAAGRSGRQPVTGPLPTRPSGEPAPRGRPSRRCCPRDDSEV